MSKCIALLHNSKVIIEQVQGAFERFYPEAEVLNIMDESLLRDIKTRGGIDHLGFRRVCRYALCAEDFGADAVMMTCSSLCETVYAARPMINIPAFAINEPMSQEAIQLGRRIGILGSLRSVLEPTARLIKRLAATADRTVVVQKRVNEKAFEALLNGDAQKHDSLLLTDVEALSRNAEVIVFAQGSMSRLVPEAQRRVQTPIMECIESGVKQVKAYFDSMP